jgi:hypothetical protein
MPSFLGKAISPVRRCTPLIPVLLFERINPWQQYLMASSDRLSHFGHRMSLFLRTLVLRGILSSERE